MEGETVEVDPAILEEMTYEEVRKSLMKYERLLERRSKRQGHELAAVADQKQLIATQQAALVQLESIADSTLAEVQEIKATIAQLTGRQAALAAESAVAPSHLAAPKASEGVAYAQRCVSDIVAGMRNFENELPQVQALLNQLVLAIDAARAVQVPDPSQPTIQEAFARQFDVQHSAIGIGSASPQAATPHRP